jgi:hypothetical protein
VPDFPHLPPGHAPGPQSRRNRQGAPILWWFVGIVGFCMFVAGVLVAAHIRRQFPWRDELIGGSIFGLAGLFCVVVAYSQYRKSRPPKLRAQGWGINLAVSGEELRRGEQVSATIIHGPAVDLEVGLVCDERYDLRATAQTKGGQITVRQTNQGPAYEHWLPVESAAGEQVMTFEIPVDAPCSYEGDCLSYLWRISAREVRRMRPDPRINHPIWVRA